MGCTSAKTSTTKLNNSLEHRQKKSSNHIENIKINELKREKSIDSPELAFQFI